jgi:antitoxin ParD1/3/4
MDVTLAPELEDIVNRKVESGEYGSAGEVISAGLRLLDERDELRQLRLEELRQEIAKGIDSLDRGERVPLDIESIKAEGRRRMSDGSFAMVQYRER